MRLFFALWPSPEAARALGEWARAVRRESGGRATRDETIHLTLAFLGEADPEKAIAAARPVRGQAFDLPVDTALYWPRQRIVWAGPREMPEASQLCVSVWNSGNPIPDDFDPVRQDGTGLRLVRELVTQLFGGRFTIGPKAEGSLAEVCVPMQRLLGA